MTKRKLYLTPAIGEGVLSKMKPGVAYIVFKLAEDFGVTTQEMRRWLRELEDAGKLQACGERYPGSAFKLAEHKVQPPYQNLRLTEDLIGYDKTLRSHAALAMSTRR
jgi:hypothetical protein